MEWIIGLTALANAFAAILAWAAKLWWSKEYKEANKQILEAKNAEIKNLERHVKSLEQLNPKTLSEWYQGAQSLSEGYTQKLENQLSQAEARIKELESQGKETELKLAKDSFSALYADYNQHFIKDGLNKVYRTAKDYLFTSPSGVTPYIEQYISTGTMGKGNPLYLAQTDVRDFSSYVSEYGLPRASDALRRYQRILDDLISGAGYEVSRVGDGHLILFPDLAKGIALLLELRDKLRNEKMLILNGKSLEIRIALHSTPGDDLSFTAIQGTLKQLSKLESEAIPMHVCISDNVLTELKDLQLSQIKISEVEGKYGNIKIAHRQSENIEIKDA